MYSTLIYEVKDQTAIITLNQPEMYNPMDQQSGPELVQALETAGANDDIRCVILTGAGKAFSAGGNVKAMHDWLTDNPGKGASPMFRRMIDFLHRSVLVIRNMPKPVIAAVNGVAAGGGLGWVLASDIIMAVPSATFDTAYIRIAASPDGGNSYFLPRLVGPYRAAEMLFLGQSIDAVEAKELGLVNHIVDAEELMDRAMDMAAKLAKQSPGALARTKALLAASLDSDLPQLLESERDQLLVSVDQPDFRIAINTFFGGKK